MPATFGGDFTPEKSVSPMPFGWGGFDATPGIAQAPVHALMSPMPFGWGGFDALGGLGCQVVLRSTLDEVGRG